MVVLPEPDSPTTPSVSPGLTNTETSSTAFTAAAAAGKYILRPTASMIGRASSDKGGRVSGIGALSSSLRTEPISMRV